MFQGQDGNHHNFKPFGWQGSAFLTTGMTQNFFSFEFEPQPQDAGKLFANIQTHNQYLTLTSYAPPLASPFSTELRIAPNP